MLQKRFEITSAGVVKVYGNLTFGDSHIIGDDADDNLLIQSSANENVIIDSADDIIFDVDTSSYIRLKDNGTEFGKISQNSNNLRIFSSISDGDILLQGNDGGSTITALTLDMSNAGSASFNNDVTITGTTYVNNVQARTSAGLKVGNDDFSGFVQVADNGQVNFDSGNSEIHFLGSGTTFGKIFKSSDNFYINNPIQDKDIIFSGNDGGSSVTALTLDMSNGGSATFGDDIDLADNKKVNFGASADLKIYHSGGASSYIENNSGDFYIMQRTLNGNLVFTCDDGSGGDATYFSLDGGTAATNELYTKFPDYSRLAFGNSFDLKIWHDASNSYIQDAGTGSLKVGAENWHLMNSALNEYMMTATPDQGVILYYDNAQKFRVTSSGVSVDSGISSSSANVLNITQATTGAIKDAVAFGVVIQNGGEATNEADLMIQTAEGGSLSEKLRVQGNGTTHIFGATASTSNSLQLKYNSSSGEASIGPRSSGGSTFMTFQTANSGTVSDRLKILSGGNTQVLGDTLLVNPSSGGNATIEVTRTSGANVFIQSQSSVGVLGLQVIMIYI